MATYCLESDLLLGDLATSTVQGPQRFVQDAADEIDLKLGRRYVTPINTAGLSTPTVLFLKRVNVYLATGHYMVNAARGDKTIHATGMWYIKQAEDALCGVADGTYELLDVELQPAYNSDNGGFGISNQDPVSLVDTFYNGGATQGPWSTRPPGVTARPYPWAVDGGWW